MIPKTAPSASAIKELRRAARTTAASSGNRSRKLGAPDSSASAIGRTPLCVLGCRFDDQFTFHRVVSAAAVLVADDAVLGRFVHVDRELRDLPGDHHRVGVGADDLEAVDHVRRGDVEGHRAVGRDRDRIGPEDELLGDNVGRVVVLADLFDPGIREAWVLVQRVGVDRPAVVVDHLDANRGGAVGDGADEAGDQQHREHEPDLLVAVDIHL